MRRSCSICIRTRSPVSKGNAESVLIEAGIERYRVCARPAGTTFPMPSFILCGLHCKLYIGVRCILQCVL